MWITHQGKSVIGKAAGHIKNKVDSFYGCPVGLRNSYRHGDKGKGLLWLFFIHPKIRIKTIVDDTDRRRSEEHTSELQSRPHLVCRLLLEKNNDPVRKPLAIESITFAS